MQILFMTYKALHYLIQDHFSNFMCSSSIDPNNSDMFCSSLNSLCFKCLCSFVHTVLQPGMPSPSYLLGSLYFSFTATFPAASLAFVHFSVVQLSPYSL